MTAERALERQEIEIKTIKTMSPARGTRAIERTVNGKPEKTFLKMMANPDYRYDKKTHSYKEIKHRAPKPVRWMTGDIETDGLFGPFIAAAISPDGNPDNVEYFDTLDDFMQRAWELREIGPMETINGAGYDLKYIFDSPGAKVRGDSYAVRMTKQGYIFRAINAGHSIVGIDMSHPDEKGSLRIMDFSFMVKGSLKNLSEDFNVEHGKLSGAIDFSKGEVFDLSNPTHKMYLRNDVLSTWEVVQSFMDAYEEVFGFPCKLKMTTPSLGRYTWLRFLQKGEVYYRTEDCHVPFLSKCMAGGMVRPSYQEPNTEFPPEQGWKLVSYDDNSHYPAMMRKGVPGGRVIKTKKYIPGKPGFYHIIADVPVDAPITILNKRIKSGLSYPVGYFETYATSLEIDLAMKMGHKVQVLEGKVYEKLVYPFDAFIDACEKGRLKYKGTVMEKVIKLIQNSVYGGFALRSEGEEIIYSETKPDAGDGAPWMRMISADGVVMEVVWIRKTVVETAYQKMEWAAWITANGRCSLVETALPYAEEGRLIYTDTDSVKLIMREDEEPVFPVHKSKYGFFKEEYRVNTNDAIFGGPKVYALRNLRGPDGEIILDENGYTKEEVKTKGLDTMRITYIDMYNHIHGVPYIQEQIDNASLRTIMQGKKENKLGHITRTMTQAANVAGWEFDAERRKFSPKIIFEECASIILLLFPNKRRTK